ncbi:MAG: hypothetical protein AAGB01_11660 [Cyanobacteria bacterium P01_F01_bin.42]
MLDLLYRQLFHPLEAPPSRDVAALVLGVLLLVMTFNAAASFQLPASALSPVLIVFAIGGFLGLFWFSAALFTLSSLFGGECEFQALLPAVLVGLWPLIFSGAAISAQRDMPMLGALFSLAILLGTFITLSRSLAAVQDVRPLNALILILVAMSLSVLAAAGVVLWPLMLLVGL